MKFQNKTTFFHVWEEKLWGNRVDANDYFSSLTVWLTMIVTAVSVCTGFFSSMDFNSDLLAQGAQTGFAMVLVCWMFNVAESIVSCKEASVIFKRSFLLLLVLIGGALAGTLLSIAIIAIVCIVFAIVVFYFIIGMLSGSLASSSRSSSNRREVEGEDYIWYNGKISGTKTLSDEFHGDDGHTYRRTGMGTQGWERVD